MNLDQLHTKFKSKKIVSLEVVFTTSDEVKEVRAGVFTFSGNKFKEQEDCQWFFNIREAVEKNGIEFPYIITFSGNGIVTKKIESFNPDASIWTQAIPNLQVDDFYYSTIVEEDQAWISLIRKEKVTDVLSELTNLKARVVQSYIGPLQVNLQVVELLNIQEKRIITPEQIIQFEEREYQHNVEGKDGQIAIMGKFYDGRYVTVLTAALSFFVDAWNDQKVSSVIQEAQIEEGYKNAMGKVIVWGVGLLFVLAVGNFMIGTYLTEKYADVTQFQSERVLVEEELNNLQIELQQKRDFLTSMGVGKKNGYSFYMDQIAGTIPHQIRLLDFNVNPIIGKVKNGQQLSIKPQTLLISGIVKNENTFNDWIKSLTELEWVKTVEIVDYEPVVKSDKYKFNVRVKI